MHGREVSIATSARELRGLRRRCTPAWWTSTGVVAVRAPVRFALQPATVGHSPTWRPSSRGDRTPVDSARTCTRWARPVRAGHGSAAVRLGDPLALVHAHLARVPVPPPSDPAVPGARRDHPASAGEGPGPPLPRAPTAWSPTWSCCESRRAGGQTRSGSGDDLPPLLLPRSRLVGREPRSPRCMRRSRTHGPVAAGRCWSAVHGGGEDRFGRPAAAGVTGSDGWFVAASSTVPRPWSSTGRAGIPRAWRLLLAEPEGELAPSASGFLVTRTQRRADPAVNPSSPRCWRCPRIPGIR